MLAVFHYHFAQDWTLCILTCRHQHSTKKKSEDHFCMVIFWLALRYAKAATVVFCTKSVLKNFAIFTGKHLCWSLFLITFQAFKPAAFQEHLFWRTYENDYVNMWYIYVICDISNTHLALLYVDFDFLPDIKRYTLTQLTQHFPHDSPCFKTSFLSCKHTIKIFSYTFYPWKHLPVQSQQQSSRKVVK